MNSRRRALALVSCAMLASALARAWRPTVKLADITGGVIDLESLIPMRFGQWKQDESYPVILPSPDVQRNLSKVYNQSLSRNYVNQVGDRIMLSVAYGGDQSDGTRAHRPESCYPAQGFAILNNDVDTLQITSDAVPMRVRRLVARAGGRWEPITYWVVVGEKIALSGTEQKVAQLNYGVRGLIPDGMLVRISNLSRDSTASYRVHDSFAKQMYLALPTHSATRIFGDRRRA